PSGLFTKDFRARHRMSVVAGIPSPAKISPPRDVPLTRRVPGWEASMARRNLWRSVATASVVLISSAAAGLVAAPAANADNNYVIVKVSNTGFSPATVNVKVGDPVIFVLQNGASVHHTITSDDGGSCPERPGAP